MQSVNSGHYSADKTTINMPSDPFLGPQTNPLLYRRF